MYEFTSLLTTCTYIILEYNTHTLNNRFGLFSSHLRDGPRVSAVAHERVAEAEAEKNAKAGGDQGP